MATLETIRRLKIHAESQGLEAVTAGLDRIADAQGKVAAGAVTVGKQTDTSAKKVISSAGAYDRLKRSIDETYRNQVLFERGQGTIIRAMEQGHITAAQAADDVLLLHQRYNVLAVGNDNLAKSTGLASHQMANLSFQLNDIATGLVSGQSPFMILAQQGGQVLQVLQMGEGGIKGAVTGIGGSLMALATPTSLAIAGVAALGAGVLAYSVMSREAIKSVDETLEAHDALITKIRDGYGEASVAAQRYATESRSVVSARIAGDIADLGRQLQIQTRDLIGKIAPVTDDLLFGTGSGQRNVITTYRDFTAAIDGLTSSAERGTPDIQAFREAVADRMSLDPNNRELQKLGFALLDASDDASTMSAKLAEAQGTLRAFGGALDVVSGRADRYAEAMRTIAGIAMPNLSNEDQVSASLRAAVADSSGASDRARAAGAAGVAMQRIVDSNVPLPRRNPKYDLTSDWGVPTRADISAARREESEAERRKKAIDDVVSSLGFEKDQLSRNAREQEQYNALQQAGITITHQRAKEVMDAAGALYDFRTAQGALNETMGEWRDFGLDITKGFVSDIRGGATALEAMDNMLTKVQDRLVDMALNSVFESAFGGGASIGGGGWLSSILGSIFGGGGGAALGQGGIGHNAAGTSNWRGGWTVVGERGPEVAYLPRGATVQPYGAPQVANQNSGSSSITVNNYAGSETEVQARRERGPDGEQVILSVVRKGTARGDLDSAMRGQYAARRQKVR
ncbi:hypothetical protein GGR25_001103 [Kaistia hirudinis]|uniref:Bacteriophage tail tape measure N-terminal domain-containing protein n=1 Tax=Kaistia hirudinis TaxID=1293440 RepID=A0A840ALG2_9HYPH|nr:phage tail length tape measure family protein [Kaistia hirudinis]MBB3930064.1 hypothetical protein [Kaistia hirudinis]